MDWQRTSQPRLESRKWQKVPLCDHLSQSLYCFLNQESRGHFDRLVLFLLMLDVLDKQPHLLQNLSESDGLATTVESSKGKKKQMVRQWGLAQ